jgi:AcrR family transcriptional regulator
VDAGAAVPQGRVARKRDRRVREILAVAAELFGERGYDAVSLEDVAERLDVTKGSLYYYFSSKEQLGTAAIETLGSEWTDRLEVLRDSLSGSASSRLRALVREHITVAVRDYPAALQLFLVPQRWPESQRRAIKGLRARHDGLFRALIEEGVASGEFRVTSVPTALRCMHASMSQSPVWFAGLRGRRLTEAVEELTDTLMMLVGEPPA